MAKPKQCSTTTLEEQEATEHVNQKKLEISEQIDSLVDEHFGRVFDRLHP